MVLFHTKPTMLTDWPTQNLSPKPVIGNDLVGRDVSNQVCRRLNMITVGHTLQRPSYTSHDFHYLPWDDGHYTQICNSKTFQTLNFEVRSDACPFQPRFAHLDCAAGVPQMTKAGSNVFLQARRHQRRSERNCRQDATHHYICVL